ncbi:hypothetical protein V7S43_012712 [Phytophthora oleae]|uniref:Uncharacterized protein n=1 Tax=Phytophthora oleae TaxID=2107226 RepID=A0ABD3F6A1_9STRA
MMPSKPRSNSRNTCSEHEDVERGIIDDEVVEIPLDSDQLINEQLYRIPEKLQRNAIASNAARPRVRLLYNDESVRDRFCANAQRLLVTALEEPANSTSARIARKALCYRNVVERLDGVNPHDPAFDVSAFFGVEWTRRDRNN